MNLLCRRRILKDISEYEKNNKTYNDEGIYIKFNEDDLLGPHYCILIGQDDTPYKGGIFPFEFNYSDQYPVKPPILKFMSLDRNCRIHPNLYGCGKVCLSIINTWNGPSWTPVMNIFNVFTSLNGIQLSNKHPIQCEPSYETEEGDLSINYNKVVQYETLRLYVIEIMKNTPEQLIIFKPIMVKYFKQFFDYYKEYCNQNINTTNLTYPTYGRQMLKTNFNNLSQELDKIIFNSVKIISPSENTN